MSAWGKMLFMGDSLTYGSREPYGLCWPYYLCHLAVRENYLIVPELEARPGRTSSELIREGVSTMMKSEAREVFFLIGTNDAKDEVRLPPELYLANLKLLVSIARAFNKRDFVLTIPVPLGFGSNNYSYRVANRVHQLNQALSSSKGQFPRLIQCEDIGSTIDGIHLSTKGAVKIAERVWMAIKKERSFTSAAGAS